MNAQDKFRILLENDDRYDPEAYNFLFEALDWALKHVVNPPQRADQHVKGSELLEGIRRYAIEQFGCLAKTVQEVWGVTKTEHWGDIVFNLVRYDLMGKQETDKIADFKDVYDFSTVFDVVPFFNYNHGRDEWNTIYMNRLTYRSWLNEHEHRHI